MSRSGRSRGSNGRLPVAVLTLVAFTAGAQTIHERQPHPRFRVARSEMLAMEAPRFQTAFVSHRHDTSAHASTLVERGDGRLEAFWFSGSREGATDVRILSATFDPDRESWSEAGVVATAESTRSGLFRHVTKLGNPAALKTTDGTLWLFYVTVTVGGWGGSSVTLIRSTDEGETWSPPRRLIGTPFLNLNTLVRGTPFEYTDGTVGLPAYQSLIQGFSEVLRVDESGSVIDKVRISRPGDGSQPAVVATSPQNAVALMRPSGRPAPGHVLLSATDDAGRRWSEPSEMPLLNPDAALDALRVPDGRILLALNDVDVERDALSLVLTDGRGRAFTRLHRLEDQRADRTRSPDDARYARIVEALARETDPSLEDPGRCVASSRLFMCWEPRCHFEFSYPSLLRTRAGEYHVLYTWNRAYIKHAWFNQAWLDERLAEARDAGR